MNEQTNEITKKLNST